MDMLRVLWVGRREPDKGIEEAPGVEKCGGSGGVGREGAERSPWSRRPRAAGQVRLPQCEPELHYNTPMIFAR